MNIQEVAEGKARLVGLNFVEPEKKQKEHLSKKNA